jgi:hypothetical protein
MALFVIIGHDARDAKEKRPTHRPAHLAHLEPLAQAGQGPARRALTDSASSCRPRGGVAAAVWDSSAVTLLHERHLQRVEVHPFLQVFPRQG